MGGIDHQSVDACFYESVGTFDGVGGDAHSGSHAETAFVILAGVRASLHLDDVLVGDQTEQMVVFINDRKLLDLVLLQDVGSFFKRDLSGGDQVLARHHLADGTVQTALETEVTVGDDTLQAIVAVNHRDTTNMVLAHQVECVPNGSIDMDGDRVGNHAVFSTFHLTNFGSLLANGHVLMKHANATLLGNGNSHA